MGCSSRLEGERVVVELVAERPLLDHDGRPPAEREGEQADDQRADEQRDDVHGRPALVHERIVPVHERIVEQLAVRPVVQPGEPFEERRGHEQCVHERREVEEGGHHECCED